MRNALRGKLFIVLICSANFVWAQDASFTRKQDSLKNRDNLTEWIYGNLDYASDQPQHREYAFNAVAKSVWRKPKNNLEKLAWLDYLNTKGYYYLQQSKILEAISSYESAFEFYQKSKQSLTSYEIIEYTLKPLSNSYTRLGDYERAVFLQQRSVDILIKSNRHDELPSTYGNLAISYRSMGNFIAAEKTILEALKITPEKHPTKISLNNIYADILFDENKMQKAKQLIDRTITNQKNINNDNAYWMMGAYTTAGNIDLKLGNFKLARARFETALNILNKYFKAYRVRERAHIVTQLGKTKLSQHQPSLAILDFNYVLKTLKIIGADEKINEQKIYGENKLMEVFEQLSIASTVLNKPDDAIKYIKLALITADKIRIEFADDKTKQRLQADTKIIVERGVEICYKQYRKTNQKKYLNTALNFFEQSKSRTLLDQIERNQQLIATNNKDSLFIKRQALERAIIFNGREEIERQASNKNTNDLKFELALINKQIKAKYKNFSFEAGLKSISTDMARFPNTRIIEYFFGTDGVYILNIKDKTITQMEKISDAKSLALIIQNFVNQYFRGGPNAMMNEPKAFFNASNQIYKSILPNIAISKNEKIIIIPDGILSYISFDGLITSSKYLPSISQWPFLIKSNTTSYAFSLKTIINHTASLNDNDFVGLFITHEKHNNTLLLAVKEEADAIRKIVKGRFLLDEEVNNDSFVKAFENSKILHIGTHAYFSSKNAEPTLDFGTEKTYLFELSSKKTFPSLVVLSACRTADGNLVNGEGVLSLSRGFTAIGTPATIAGLWNVNDKAVSVITANFYEHLIDRKSGSEALNLAKLDWLNQPQGNEAMYLPYYWDSLIYTGVDQTLALKAPMSGKALLIALIIISLITLIFVGRKSFSK